jgi:hypothetical protein
LPGTLISAPQDSRCGHRSSDQAHHTFKKLHSFEKGIPIEWGGARWAAYIRDFIPADDQQRRGVLMLHELFHCIQPQLGLMTQDGQNEHMDTLEGR